jgi:hypothetical protein
MNIPESMTVALAAWNNGKGTDLESWIRCEGNFSLAVGYTTIFWPDFVEFEGYILHGGFSQESLRALEKREAGNRKSVESLMNHLHIADVRHFD